MSTCTVGTLNVHNRARAARFMLKQRCDVLALSEANTLSRMLARRARYRVVVGASGRDKRRGASTMPVLVHREHASLGEIAWQAAERATPERLAPDRWVTVAAQHVAGFGDVAVVNVHPHPLTDGRKLDVARVRETAELWGTVSRLLAFLADEGLFVVLVGDVNARKGDDTPGWTGAYDVIDEHELRAVSRGLDVIAYDKRLRAVERDVFPRERHGSDHPAIVVELRRAG